MNIPNPIQAHTSRAIWCLAALGLCLGTGCELLGLSDPGTPPADPNPQQQPPRNTPPPNTPPAQPDAKAEEEKPYERPEYPENLGRNPFALDVETVMPSVVAKVEEERPVEPLEQFTLSQLTLIGVISETAVPKAMFVDSDGFGHVVKEGDRIGRQGGIITDIRDNEVDIQEGGAENTQAPSSVRTLRLSDTEIRNSSDDNELSDAERQALDRLMKSEEGREKLRANLREQLNRENTQGQNTQNTGAGIAPPVQ